MTFNNNRARHRAQTTIAGRGRTIGSAAAVVAAGSGMLLSMAAPASAGVVANDAPIAPAPAAVAPAAPVAPVAPVAEAPAVAPAASTHTVQSGDTLGVIASTYGVSLDSILSLNGLALESIIYPGDVITYAGAAAPAAAAPVAAAPVAETFAAPAAPAAPAAAVEAPAAAAANTGVITTQSTDVTPVASSAASSPVGQIMVDSAFAQLGAAQDCTVLVEVALRAAGHSVGDLAPAQLAAYGTQVSDPQPGDMIYYADGGMGLAHIAIYIGDGQAIHSGWNGNQTVIQSANVGSGPVYYRA